MRILTAYKYEQIFKVRRYSVSTSLYNDGSECSRCNDESSSWLHFEFNSAQATVPDSQNFSKFHKANNSFVSPLSDLTFGTIKDKYIFFKQIKRNFRVKKLFVNQNKLCFEIFVIDRKLSVAIFCGHSVLVWKVNALHDVVQ